MLKLKQLKVKQHVEIKNTVIQWSVSLYHNFIVLLCGWWQQQDSTCDVRMYNFASGVNFCGENVCEIIFCRNFFFSADRGKSRKIAKIRTRKNLVPYGIIYQKITFSERCHFCNPSPPNSFLESAATFYAYCSFAIKTFYNVAIINGCTQPCGMESKISDFDDAWASKIKQSTGTRIKLITCSCWYIFWV